MKNQTRVLVFLFLLTGLLLTSCGSAVPTTGKEQVKSDQAYHNYDAAMKRLKKADKKQAKSCRKRNR